MDSLCHYIAMSQSGREKEVIVGLLSYRDGAMWEEERAEWRRARGGGKEKNSNETRRRRQAEALSECPHMVNFWMCNQKKKKKNPFVCGKCFYCFLVASERRELQDMCQTSNAFCLLGRPVGFDDNPGGLGWH